MLDQLNNRYLLVPGEYGFMAPDNDRNGVTELASYSFSSCFALSVTDREKRAALLAHVDYPPNRNCNNLAPDSINLFKEYGSQNLTIGTANLVDLNDGSILTRTLEEFVLDFMDKLRNNGFNVTRSTPKGKASFVIATSEGLTITPDNRTPEQRAALRSRAEKVFSQRFTGISQKGSTTLLRGYVPNLVLPCT